MDPIASWLRRLWFWWRYTPPPPRGWMSARWMSDHVYRAGTGGDA